MIFVFIGASGNGKGTFGKVFEEMGIPRAISFTSREPREGEVEGVNYFFKSVADCLKLIDQGLAAASDFHRGAYYGTAKSQFEKAPDVFCEMSKTGVHDLEHTFGKDNIKVIYVYTKAALAHERLNKRDGDEKAKEKMMHAVKEGEYNNIDIAELVLLNNTSQECEFSKYILKKFIQTNSSKSYRWD